MNARKGASHLKARSQTGHAHIAQEGNGGAAGDVYCCTQGKKFL